MASRKPKAKGAGRIISILLQGPWGVPWIILFLVLLDARVLYDEIERLLGEVLLKVDWARGATEE